MPQQHQDFQRTIGLSTATALIIATIIGSGIFMRPAEMAGLLGSTILIFSVWIIAGLFTMLSVMVLAEVAAMIPRLADLMHSCAICMEISGLTYMAGLHLRLSIVPAGRHCFYYFTIFGVFFYTASFLFRDRTIYCFTHSICWRLLPLQNFGVKTLTIILLCILTFISYRSTKSSGFLMKIFSAAKVAAIIL
jgi:APA family basic amino acid/polyamine antiporter